MPSEPDDAAAHYNLGVALGKKGDPDGAIEEYREALRLNPNLAAAYEGLGVELGQKGNKDGAIVEFREAIRIKPDFAGAHYNLGFALSDKGEIDGAIAEFREALRLDPDYEAAHYQLGAALCIKGELDRAMMEFRDVVRLNPENAYAHYALGIGLHNKRDLDGAIAEFRTAIRLKPDFADAHHELGRVLRSEREIRGSTVTRFFGELGFGAGYFLMVALVYVSSRFDGWIFGTTHAITLADLMAFICFSTLWVLWAMNQYYKYFTAPSEERNAFPTSAGPFCPTFAYMPTPGMGVSPAMIIGGAIGAGAGGMATPTHPWVGAFLGVLIGMPGGQMASMGLGRLGTAMRRWGTRKD
jgi:Flp pilus assembly protein TadD